MTALIGALRVSLSAETANFEAGMRRAQTTTAATSAAISKSLESIKASLAGFAAAIGVGLLATGIESALKYAGSLGEVAKTLGVTTKDLQTFRFAATQSGVAQDQLEVGLRRLTVSIGKSKLGSEAQTKAFGALAKVTHTTVDEFRSGTTGDVFRRMADALSKVSDRSQRAAIEMALMGRSGSTLDNLLAPGSKRLNDLAEAAQTLGIILSDGQIQGAEQTAHKLEAVKTVLEAQIAGVVANNAGAILSLSSALATLTSEIVKFLGSNPQLALGIIGALLGGRVGGLPGAVIGSAAGAILGGKLGQISSDGNQDLQFRIAALKKAQQQWIAAKNGTQMAGLAGAEAFFGGRGVATDEKSAYSEWLRQKKLLDQAIAQSGATNQSAPGVDLPKFLAGNKKAKKPPADRSSEVLDQMDKEIIQANQSILQAKLQLAGSSEERLRISVQLVEIEKAVKDKAIDDEVDKAKRDLAEHKITQAAYQEVLVKAKALKNANAIEAQTKLQALVEEQLTKAEKANLAITDQQYGFKIDALKAADQLATTDADHRRIQLEILDLEIERKRKMLEGNLLEDQRNGAAAEEIKVIQDQIDHLAVEKAQGQAQIMHNTQSPLESYFSQLPHTAQEVNQALQSIEVEGIQGLSNALAQVGHGWGAMRNAAIQALQDIASKLIELGIQRMLFSLFGNILGGGGGGGSGLSGFAAGAFSTGSFAGDLAAPMSVTGMATGGSIMVGGNAGVDRNLLSLNGLPIARVSYGETINVDNGSMKSATAPPFIFNNYARMSAAEARATGAQAAAGWSDQMARMRGKGLGG